MNLCVHHNIVTFSFTRQSIYKQGGKNGNNNKIDSSYICFSSNDWFDYSLFIKLWIWPWDANIKSLYCNTTVYVYTVTHMTHNKTKHPTMIGFQREDFFSISAPLLFLSLKEVAARIFLRFTTNILFIFFVLLSIDELI